MRLLSNLHVKGKPAVLPDRAIRGQSHYFIYRPCNYLFCVEAAYVNSQKKPIPLNAGFRVVVDDLDLCYHNEY